MRDYNKIKNKSQSWAMIGIFLIISVITILIGIPLTYVASGISIKIMIDEIIFMLQGEEDELQ